MTLFAHASCLSFRHQAAAAIAAFAVAFNVPYTVLTLTFDYPQILRRPGIDVLSAFHAGGASLILTWHAFGLLAALFIPVAILIAVTQRRATPILAASAALVGALAGLVQAIGLWRWVFVVPSLAATAADPTASAAAKAQAVAMFDVLNLYGGVAIGEHLGQWLTAGFVLLVARMQFAAGEAWTGRLALATAALIGIGTTEGLAIALGRSGDVFGLFTVLGYLALTAWLIAIGVTLWQSAVATPQASEAPGAR
jgi:hypothetical protein